MFTGIIEATADILQKDAHTLTLRRPAMFDDIKEGSSIAVSGACLSVTKFDQTFLQFDVVDETWSKTKLGLLAVGDPVNLERALAANGRFDGHMVQGHVEGTGVVTRVAAPTAEAIGTVLTIELPPQLAKFVIPKGSIAIDGVSLTVADIRNQQSCSLALIPHTLSHTMLGQLKVGDLVNIETDLLGRYVATLLTHSSSAS